MARVQSTARVSREREETEATETTPISEVMKRSGLIVADEGTSNVEAEKIVIEGEDAESEEDYSILIPTKPSHLDFEKSTVSEANLFDLLEKRLPLCRKRLKLWFSRASSERDCDFP
jgi:CBS domain-containing protein